MLQLIGWLGCAYLAVRLLEMLANPAFRDENGALNVFTQIAMWMGWLSVSLFALAFLMQGIQLPQFIDDSLSSGSDYEGADVTEIPIDEALEDAEADYAVEMPSDEAMAQVTAEGAEAVNTVELPSDEVMAPT